jgi:hypothetical protein
MQKLKERADVPRADRIGHVRRPHRTNAHTGRASSGSSMNPWLSTTLPFCVIGTQMLGAASFAGSIGLGEIRDLIFDPWFYGARLRDTSHRTTGRIERWKHLGATTAIMSLEEPRPPKGRCSASAPTGFASVRPSIIFDARFAAALSPKDRCRTLRKDQAVRSGSNWEERPARQALVPMRGA